MPHALALMVLCPDNNKMKPLTECKRCGYYYGIMNEEMVSCEKIEDELPKTEVKKRLPCPTLARRSRGLVCGAPNGICTKKHDAGIECLLKPDIKRNNP